MIVILFDTNVYDRLEVDVDARNMISNLIEFQKIKVLMNRTVREELSLPPFSGVPDFFTIEQIGNTVARSGIMRAGDSLGSGEVFIAHRGTSNSQNDALIADAAACRADWLVTCDGRMRRQMIRINAEYRVMNYDEFLVELTNIGV